MKKVKRNFLNSVNRISFKKKNNYIVTLYFDPSKLSAKSFYLYFDKLNPETIKKLKVNLIYFNPSRNVTKYENVESKDSLYIMNDSIGHQYIPTSRINVKFGGGILWKLEFQSTEMKETDIYFHADDK